MNELVDLCPYYIWYTFVQILFLVGVNLSLERVSPKLTLQFSTPVVAGMCLSNCPLKTSDAKPVIELRKTALRKALMEVYFEKNSLVARWGHEPGRNIWGHAATASCVYNTEESKASSSSAVCRRSDDSSLVQMVFLIILIVALVACLRMSQCKP